MNTMKHGPSSWIRSPSTRITAVDLKNFINTLNREIKEVLLPSYHKANKVVVRAFKLDPLTLKAAKLALSPEMLVEYQQARSDRAKYQQELQVVVPAVRFARAALLAVQRGYSHQHGYSQQYPIELLRAHLLSHALRAPKAVLWSQRYVPNGYGHSKLSFGFKAMTLVGAAKARAVLNDHPSLFEGMSAWPEYPSRTNKESMSSMEKDRLYRKILSTVELDEIETNFLDSIFSKK